jgi:hypothetical protein
MPAPQPAQQRLGIFIIPSPEETFCAKGFGHEKISSVETSLKKKFLNIHPKHFNQGCERTLKIQDRRPQQFTPLQRRQIVTNASNG